MKMKSLSMIAIAVCVCMSLFIGLSGCASDQTKPIPPAQVLAIACPPVQAAIAQFEALDATLPNVPAAAKAGAALAKIQPTVQAACAAGGSVSLADVQSFAQTVLPVLGTVAGTLPLPPQQLAQVQAGLVAAEIAVGAVGVVEQQIKGAHAAPASASSSSPAK